MFSLVTTQFNNYVGTGLMVALYLAAFIYLFVVEKRKEIRLLLVYMPLVVLVIFFNPWIAQIIVKYAEEDVYYRIMWLVPVGITIVYAMVNVISGLKGKARMFGFVAAILLVVFSGRLAYTDKAYSVAENEYHVPQNVVDICDAIVVPGREVMAAFPSDMLVYVRQYTQYVCMPYGWNEEKEIDYYLSELREVLDKVDEPVEAEKLATLAHSTIWSCHYIIVSEKKIINGNMSDYGYEEWDHIDEYIIYRDANAEL